MFKRRVWISKFFDLSVFCVSFGASGARKNVATLFVPMMKKSVRLILKYEIMSSIHIINVCTTFIQLVIDTCATIEQLPLS